MQAMAQTLLALSVIVGGFPLDAIAQDYVPPNRGLPGRREGGGTRGCWTNSTVAASPIKLTALVPAQNFGYTLQAYPTFLVYVPPFFAEKAAGVEFILNDAQDNEVYRTTFEADNTSGIIRLSLPTDANLPPLEVGKDYHWSFALVCDLADPSGNLVVDSWIQRTRPSAELTAALGRTAAQDLPALYARSGIWYDAIAQLTPPQAQPRNAMVLSQWRNLLNSVGLNTIAGTLPPATPNASRTPSAGQSPVRQ